MEVIYSGLFCTPEQVAKIAIDEDVDVVAMSLLKWSTSYIIPQSCDCFKGAGVSDILLIGGGVIPGKDKKLLEEKGVKGNFGPGTPLEDIIDLSTIIQKIAVTWTISLFFFSGTNVFILHCNLKKGTRWKAL